MDLPSKLLKGEAKIAEGAQMRAYESRVDVAMTLFELDKSRESYLDALDALHSYKHGANISTTQRDSFRRVMFDGCEYPTSVIVDYDYMGGLQSELRHAVDIYDDIKPRDAGRGTRAVQQMAEETRSEKAISDARIARAQSRHDNIGNIVSLSALGCALMHSYDGEASQETVDRIGVCRETIIDTIMTALREDIDPLEGIHPVMSTPISSVRATWKRAAFDMNALSHHSQWRTAANESRPIHNASHARTALRMALQEHWKLSDTEMPPHERDQFEMLSGEVEVHNAIEEAKTRQG